MSEGSLNDSTEMENLVSEQMDSLTRLKNELINFKKESQDRRTKHHINIRLDRIKETRATVLSTHRKLIAELPSNDDYFKNDFLDGFENSYVDVCAYIHAKYDEWFPSTVMPAQTIVASGGASSQQTPIHIVATSTDTPFKLPQLTIPQFSGVYTEWPEFYDAFLQIHSHDKLNNNHKFQYLRNSLSPKVKSLIGYLDITADNYTTAWNALIKRFNNKRVLFSSYMEKFLNQPTMAHESAEDLQSMHDVSQSCVFALEKLGVNIAECGTLFAHVLIKKFSPSTRLEWEKQLGKSDAIPNFDTLLEFIDLRFRTLEAMYPQSKSESKSVQAKQSQQSNKSNTRKETKSFHVSAKTIKCVMCEQPHVLRKCPNFLQSAPVDRLSFVTKAKICSNCLGHSTSQPCISTKTCFICHGKHHTLLHIGKSTTTNSNNQNNFAFQSTSAAFPTSTLASEMAHSQTSAFQPSLNNAVNAQSSCVLLTTALINIVDTLGNLIIFRALVDQCSQHSVITERAAQRLKLPIESICVGVKPMGESQYKLINRGMSLRIRSITNPEFEVTTTVAIMPTVTSDLPLYPIKTKQWSHIKGLPLADPHYKTPGQIDMLLAGDVYAKILESGLCKGQPGEPIAQQTALGWILSGEIAHQNHVTIIQIANNCLVSTVEIGNYIKKFYELEEVPDLKTFTDEDKWTETFYEQTTVRHSNGKFMVRLPLRSNFDASAQLGSSFSMAYKRFQSLQRRFAHDNEFREAYTKTFNEYKQLNQVKLVKTINDDKQTDPIQHFYLPHHAVLKETSLTTKLRQVFDGSAKSSNGKSLNDILTKGPSLQSDIVSIILNWRTLEFVFIADIEKMYRCIQIHPDDTQYQLLLWQDDENSGIQTYALQTVTFGIVSSPYQAIKTIQTLAQSERVNYPLAYSAIMSETYVDDVTTGHETIDGAIELLSQLIHMLRSAGFELRKWSSNSKEILQHIPNQYQENQTECLLNANESIKALGLTWSTVTDSFSFNVNFPIEQHLITKRSILSVVARLYDPLGWLNPFVTMAKLFMKRLWEANIKWDETPPTEFQTEWKIIVDQFQYLNQIKIPRWINVSSKNKINDIHIFCDSSLKAYAAAVYLRTIDNENNIHTHLLIAKSKLVPVKIPLTIPRAELCGAVLATKLLDSIKSIFRLKINKYFMWTDSSVVLSWIRGDPKRWAPFVYNRVHQIMKSSEIDQWKHVISKENPADCNSRGLTVLQLSKHDLWWQGPHWLSQVTEHWPTSPFNTIDDDPDELRSKYKSINATFNELSRLDFILSRFSNLNRLRHCFAYFLRYTKVLRDSARLGPLKINASGNKRSFKEKLTRISPPTVEELERSEMALVRWIQTEHFEAEFKAIRKNTALPRSSKLIRLNPFIDSNGILRVGGRLHNAIITFDEKHPIILPAKHRFGQLIMHEAHAKTIHGGPLVTVNYIRQKYWILNIRNATRHFIHKCVVCFKHKPILASQLMGSLPSPRVNYQSRAFTSTIIDYAGPYDIRASKGRGQASYKGYVAVFTCMATKAVHLEAAGDCSTQTFLHAFERFISRRGLCYELYSDCGTNFVGASNDFKRSQAEFEQYVSNEILPFMNTRQIRWHFSPPGAPHFNGLAEAAVKSMKFHLARIVGEAKLTFEEFSTVLARIESVLNSRPISPSSDNANDFSALTPGHFLIGSALLARPQPPTDENPTKRHQLMERMIQHFWHRFRNEMLSTMQIRPKWQSKQPNIRENDLVIIKDERFPVNQWPLGRIHELHKGQDGLIRVATVKTRASMFKRPITKLCLVPINDLGSDSNPT